MVHNLQFSLASSTMRSLMFKITRDTINGFTLAEILLMAAMNEIEATRNTSAKGSNPRQDQLGASDGR